MDKLIQELRLPYVIVEHISEKTLVYNLRGGLMAIM